MLTLFQASLYRPEFISPTCSSSVTSLNTSLRPTSLYPSFWNSASEPVFANPILARKRLTPCKASRGAQRATIKSEHKPERVCLPAHNRTMAICASSSRDLTHCIDPTYSVAPQLLYAFCQPRPGKTADAYSKAPIYEALAVSLIGGDLSARCMVSGDHTFRRKYWL